MDERRVMGDGDGAASDAASEAVGFAIIGGSEYAGSSSLSKLAGTEGAGAGSMTSALGPGAMISAPASRI